MREPAMVLDNSRRQISKLASLAEELNRASDAFTKELVIIESELERLNLGVEVTLAEPLEYGDWEPEHDEDGDETGDRQRFNNHLSYRKHVSRWRLVVCEYLECEGENVELGAGDDLMDTTPLVQASRELRIAAAGQIDTLLELISKEATAKLESLNKVLDKPESPTGNASVAFVVPRGWASRLLGLDDMNQVHVSKGPGFDEALCGARIITSSFPHADQRACPKCLRLTK